MKSENKLPAIVLILILSLFVSTCGIWWGLPSIKGWAADELIPLRVLEGIEQGFSNGWHYKYPPFQFYLLTILYSPLLLLHHLHIVDVYSLPTYTILFYIGRFLSVIQGTALVFIVYLCGREIYDKRASAFAALITVLSCTFVYYSKTINLDVPYLFWFVLSLLFYLRILKYQQLRDYLLFSASAAIAVCTKDQAYAFYILTPIFIVWQHHRHLKQQNKTIKLIDSLSDRKITLSLLLGITLFILFHNILFNLEGFIEHVNAIATGDASIRPRFEKNIFGYLTMLRQSVTHLRFSLGWPMYAICLVGFLRVVYQRNKHYLLCSLLIPLISYYLFYISVVWYNNVRYLMPYCIIAAFFGGHFIAEFLQPAQKLFKAKLVLIGAIFIYTFAYAFSANIWMVQDSRYYVERWMEQNIDKSALVLNAGIEKYLPRLDNFKSEHIDEPSLEVLSQKNPDYIIVSSGYDIRRFEENTPEYEFYDRLNEEIGYKLVLKYQSKPKWNLLNESELRYRDVERMYIYSNFDKINPEIRIFQKMGAVGRRGWGAIAFYPPPHQLSTQHRGQNLTTCGESAYLTDRHLR